MEGVWQVTNITAQTRRMLGSATLQSTASP